MFLGYQFLKIVQLVLILPLKNYYQSHVVYKTGFSFRCVCVDVRDRQRDGERKSFSVVYYIITWLSPMGTSVTRVSLVTQQIKEKKNNPESEMSNACFFLSHVYFKTKTRLSKQENLVSFMCAAARLFQAHVYIGSKCFTDRCGAHPNSCFWIKLFTLKFDPQGQQSS